MFCIDDGKNDKKKVGFKDEVETSSQKERETSKFYHHLYI